MDDIQDQGNSNKSEKIDDYGHRDENRSPTSGSSSETTQDNSKGAGPLSRKHRRHSRAKRKRKWKPYSELSWDEKQVQDDRETKRACAKREKLSAEGHPIAPYNTTQFLMDDHKLGSPDISKDDENDVESERVTEASIQAGNLSTTACNGLRHDTKHPVSDTESPVLPDSQSKGDEDRSIAGLRDDIQMYILQDFSHAYADYHAEQLQSMSKDELVKECIRLEKRVESLERKVKHCQKKHADGSRNQADIRLLEKINQLQGQNAQLLKESNSLRASSIDANREEAADKLCSTTSNS